MNKRIKWGIIILIGAGLAGLGIYQFTPHENEELTAADALPKENKQRTLKVNAHIIRKSKFPWFPERSVQFSGKRTKRSVQKKGCTQHL